MAIIQKVSAYDSIMLQRAKRADAAALAEARSEARRAAVQNTLAKSDTLRYTLANAAAQNSADQSQLMARIIQSRVAADAKAKAAADKWYR